MATTTNKGQEFEKGNAVEVLLFLCALLSCFENSKM